MVFAGLNPQLSIFFFTLQTKETFVSAAKDVIINCQSVTQFIKIIANHCLDKQCTDELSLIVDQILTITNQFNIISRSDNQLSKIGSQNYCQKDEQFFKK